MISKKKIEKRLKKKSDCSLVETIIKLKKSNPEVAKLLSKPKKLWGGMNLGEIENKVKDNEQILVPGKILSSGKLSKKIDIVAWSISQKAYEKLKESKSSFKEIRSEVKTNPELKGLRILK